jgi:hypothetical protein
MRTFTPARNHRASSVHNSCTHPPDITPARASSVHNPCTNATIAYYSPTDTTPSGQDPRNPHSHLPLSLGEFRPTVQVPSAQICPALEDTKLKAGRPEHRAAANKLNTLWFATSAVAATVSNNPASVSKLSDPRSDRKLPLRSHR